MAKALMGHVGTTDFRMLSEVARLRAHVAELEAQVLRLEAENDALAAEIHREELLSLGVDDKTPALVGSRT